MTTKVKRPPAQSGDLCSKCGLPGEFRGRQRQCRGCERAKGRIAKSTPEAKTKGAEYREARRDHYKQLNAVGQRRKKAERHAAIDTLKSVPCVDCKKIFPPYVMDFDHREPADKKHEINFLVNKTSAPWQRILDEIAKCDVVCVCCHRMRTWKAPTQKVSNTRQLIRGLKNEPCKDCDQNFHYAQMDFDHVRDEKLNCVPHCGSMEAILNEAAKCDLVCANCHRKRTHQFSKGAQRTDPEKIDMFWQRKTVGSQQTLIAGPPPKLEVPRFRAWHSLAGNMPDKEVAQIGGITPSNVLQYRRKVGIPSFQFQMRENRNVK